LADQGLAGDEEDIAAVRRGVHEAGVEVTIPGADQRQLPTFVGVDVAAAVVIGGDERHGAVEEHRPVLGQHLLGAVAAGAVADGPQPGGARAAVGSAGYADVLIGVGVVEVHIAALRVGEVAPAFARHRFHAAPAEVGVANGDQMGDAVAPDARAFIEGVVVDGLPVGGDADDPRRVGAGNLSDVGQVFGDRVVLVEIGGDPVQGGERGVGRQPARAEERVAAVTADPVELAGERRRRVAGDPRDGERLRFPVLAEVDT
jgi:hypothetical protein